MPSAPSATPLHILLIEDDPLAAKLLQDAFTAHQGVAVTWLSTAAEAIDRLGNVAGTPDSRPDMILCERSLPDGRASDVIQAAKTAQAVGPIQLLVITSMPASATAAVSQTVGTGSVVAKETIAKDPAGWVADLVQTVNRQTRLRRDSHDHARDWAQVNARSRAGHQINSPGWNSRSHPSCTRRWC